MENIRVQSEDLREELKELERWEEEMQAAEAARKKRMKMKSTAGGSTTGAPATANHSDPSVVEPPIRGTVASIKNAMAKASEEKRKLAGPDPVQLAKEKGNEYFRLNKIADAIEAYTEGIETDSNNAAAYILYANRSMCYLRQEQWDKAERDASISVSMHATYPKAYYRRAMAYKNLGKLKEARRDLEAVLALAPTDIAAKNELESVTKLLQAERAKQESTATKAKKIMIEEVDDDDDDDDDDNDDQNSNNKAQNNNNNNNSQQPTAGSSSSHVAMSTSSSNATENKKKITIVEEAEEEEEEEDKEAEALLRAQQAAEVARREQEAEAQRRRQIEEANRLAAKKQKRDHRVEEVVEEVTATPTATAATASPSSSSTTAAPPTTRKPPAVTLSKESLKTPKSFSEFERVFASVEKEGEELRNHYISLLQPSELRALFGSNLTPELLHGILSSLLGLSSSQAYQMLKGLSRVNRIEDITMFLSAEEMALMDRVMQYAEKAVESEGSAPGEWAGIKRKLKP